jgi:alpha-tubulin suppressor-like RCC1 family protein
MAVLKGDGSVLTWGHADCGGDCASIKTQLEGGVEQVVAGGHAMAALKRDGSVLTWGNAICGGDCTSVKAQLADGIEQIVAPARHRIRGKRPLSL